MSHIYIHDNIYINYIIYKNYIIHIIYESKKITRSGNLRTNTTSSGMSIDTKQQNVIFNQTDIETMKVNIANINISYNNRTIILENENDTLKRIIKQSINIDF
jgi:hypothetical protein